MALTAVLSFNSLAAAIDDISQDDSRLLQDIQNETLNLLEELVFTSVGAASKIGYASYYASRLEGRRTTSGERYSSEKFTAAHSSLPLGAVVRVINYDTKLDVIVTVNDRCARKPYPFIDLSAIAAKKIGLYGKGKVKVEIMPLSIKQKQGVR